MISVSSEGPEVVVSPFVIEQSTEFYETRCVISGTKSLI